MKCYTGFLTTRDPLTKKSIPFFVKTRRKDVISEVFDYDIVKVSNIYRQEKEVHSLDSVTIFDKTWINIGEIVAGKIIGTQNGAEFGNNELAPKGHGVGFKGEIANRFSMDGTSEHFGEVTLIKEPDNVYEIIIPYVHVDETQVIPDCIQVSRIEQVPMNSGTTVGENIIPITNVKIVKRKVENATLDVPTIMNSPSGIYYVYYCIQFTDTGYTPRKGVFHKFYVKRRRTIVY